MAVGGVAVCEDAPGAPARGNGIRRLEGAREPRRILEWFGSHHEAGLEVVYLGDVLRSRRRVEL